MGTKEAVILALLKMGEAKQDDFSKIEPLLNKLVFEQGLKDFNTILSPENDTLVHLCAKYALNRTLNGLAKFCGINQVALDFSAINIEGRTALHFSAMFGNGLMTKYLIQIMVAQEGPMSIQTIDKLGMMPIHMPAAFLKSKEMQYSRVVVESYLTDAGANLNQEIEGIGISAFDLSGEFPAFLPSLHVDIFGRTQLIRKIIEAAILNLVKEKTPEQHQKLAHLEVEIKLLIQKLPDLLERPDRLNRTPLMYATYFSYEPMVKFLIGYQQTNVKAVDSFGMNALHIAAFDHRGANQNIVKLLLNNGAEDSANNAGQKPSDIANQYNMTEVSALIKAGPQKVNFNSSVASLESLLSNLHVSSSSYLPSRPEPKPRALTLDEQERMPSDQFSRRSSAFVTIKRN
jgi:ankyrin repeat protein